MEQGRPIDEERRLTSGEITDRQPRFIRLSSVPGYEGHRPDVESTLPDGDDGIRSGDEIRAELAELLDSLDA